MAKRHVDIWGIRRPPTPNGALRPWESEEERAAAFGHFLYGPAGCPNYRDIVDEREHLTRVCGGIEEAAISWYGKPQRCMPEPARPDPTPTATPLHEGWAVFDTPNQAGT